MYTLYYISKLTVVKELVKRVENVFAERLKLETPFVSALTACIRGFFMDRILGFNGSFPNSRKVDKRIWVTRIQSRVLKGRTGRNAKYSISGISERKGDIISGKSRSRCGGSHYNKKQYRINDFFSTCFNSYCFKGLDIGAVTLNPLKE
jgi:hypothetical protein